MQNNFFNISGLIFRLTIVFIAYTLLRMKKEKFIMHGKFQSIMALTQKLEKVPKKFGTGQLLSHSEIHLIEIIGDNEELRSQTLERPLE